MKVSDYSTEIVGPSNEIEKILYVKFYLDYFDLFPVKYMYYEKLSYFGTPGFRFSKSSSIL